MNNTKIDWCDMSWNPVTGCLHDCDYCYARGIAHRFGSADNGKEQNVLEQPYRDVDLNCELECEIYGSINPYPFGFSPTLHRYRLDEPARTKKPKIIFVGSMCDLFGAWVPNEWIEAVFEACAAAPQHQYLFLTKNPQRYNELLSEHLLPMVDNFWYGGTRTGRDSDREHEAAVSGHSFLSIEPMLAPVEPAALDALGFWDWVIIGAMSGRDARKNRPRREWIKEVVDCCAREGIPLFMKDSLTKIWGEPLIQQWPESMKGVWEHDKTLENRTS